MAASDERTQSVLAVLAAADTAIGPTEIARRIDESWCVTVYRLVASSGRDRLPQSNVITPILKPLVESGDVVREAGGKYRLARKRSR